MEPRTKKKIGKSHRWSLKDVLEDLKRRGAIEIPPSEIAKEPYKTLMKNVRKNGKFICD